MFSSSRIHRKGAWQNGTGTSGNFGSLKISPIDSTCENTIRNKKNYSERFLETCFRNSKNITSLMGKIFRVRLGKVQFSLVILHR